MRLSKDYKEMKNTKIKHLKKAGWRVGDVQEFLGLSDQEMLLIEIKRSLVRVIRETRETKKITQQTLAKMLDSSQSRVAKLEAASRDVSLDLIVKALLVLGIKPKDLGRFISSV